MFVDLEPSVIGKVLFFFRINNFNIDPNHLTDEIRLGTYRQLFSPSSMIIGREDAASNYARGKLTLGSEFIDYVMDRIKLAAESSNSLQGFMLFRALGGGTGSGFGNLILDRLKEDYPKVPRIEFDVFPSPKYIILN